MSQNINEPVPSPQPTGAVSAYTEAGSPSKPLNTPGVIFPAISRITGTYNSNIIYNPTARGVRLMVLINPTGPATGTYNLRIEIPSDTAQTVWKPLLGTLSTGVTGDGTGASVGAYLTVYPGLTGIADAGGANGPVTINDHLGPVWRAKLVTTLDTLTVLVTGNYLM